MEKENKNRTGKGRKGRKGRGKENKERKELRKGEKMKEENRERKWEGRTEREESSIFVVKKDCEEIGMKGKDGKGEKERGKRLRVKGKEGD